MKNLEDVSTYLIELQRRVDIWSLRALGLDLAPLFLVQIWFRLFYAITGAPLSPRPGVLSQLRVLSDSLTSGLQFLSRPEADSIILMGRSNHRFLSSGKWKNVFLDPLRPILTESGYAFEHWEWCPRGILSGPRLHPAINLSGVGFLSKLAAGTLQGRALHELRKNSAWAELSAFLSQESLLESDAEAQTLAAQAARVAVLAKCLRTFLKRRKAKCVLICNYYNDEGFATTHAAWSLGLESADLQHGVQGPTHPAYGLLRPPRQMTVNTLPGTFWVWSEEERTAFDSWRGAAGVTVHVTGHPLLQEPVSKFQVSKEASLKVLISLQPGIELPEFVWVVTARRKDVSWIFRLHPNMRREKASWERLLAGRVPEACLDIGDVHIFEQLQKVNGHATVCSSVVLDAENLNIQSALLGSQLGAEIFSETIERGVAKVVESAEEFEGWLENLPDSRVAKPTEGRESISRALSAMLS